MPRGFAEQPWLYPAAAAARMPLITAWPLPRFGARRSTLSQSPSSRCSSSSTGRQRASLPSSTIQQRRRYGRRPAMVPAMARSWL